MKSIIIAAALSIGIIAPAAAEGYVLSGGQSRADYDYSRQAPQEFSSRARGSEAVQGLRTFSPRATFQTSLSFRGAAGSDRHAVPSSAGGLNGI